MIESRISQNTTESYNHTPSAFVRMIEVEPGVFTLPPQFSSGKSLHLSVEFREFRNYVQARSNLFEYLRQARSGFKVDETVEYFLEESSPIQRKIAYSLVTYPEAIQTLLMVADKKTVAVQSIAEEVNSRDLALTVISELSKNALIRLNIDTVSITDRGLSIVEKLRDFARKTKSNVEI